MIKVIALCLVALTCAVYAQPSCEEYCTAVMANCTGSNDQYSSFEQCNISCSGFPLGLSNDTFGNTVGCRHYHAVVAGINATMADIHCPHAGPSGGNVCGTFCEGYCSVFQYNCRSSGYAFASNNTCMTVCQTFNTSGSTLSTSGNTYQCRLSWAVSASQDDTDCAYATSDGGNQCGSINEGYCHLIQAACTGANTQYTSQAACEDYVSDVNMQLGTFGMTTNNTEYCRIYHAEVASSTQANIHCPHAGPTGGNACGSWCEVYCQVIEEVCWRSNDTQYANLTQCMSTCATFPTNGAIGATAGNTVQCRLYHLGVASQSSANAQTHCPHAGPSGGGVCVDATSTTTTTTGTSTGSASSLTAGFLAVLALFALFL